jgi:hypothetical protein
MKFGCSPRNKANMRCCKNITRCRGLAQARLTMRLENESTEFGKIVTRQLLSATPLFAKRGSIAVLPTWHIGTKIAKAP